MDLALRGKVVWLTGGSDGLGAAMARRLAEEGASLAICARNEERLEAVARDVAAAGSPVLAQRADVTVPEDLERFARSAQERFGRLDALINNAGRASAAPFESVDDAAWQSDVELKLFAATRLTRLGLPLLRVSKGCIVNVLALAAKTPGARSAPSSVTRAAGMALTKALSKELGPAGIRANAVLVGVVESGQWVAKAKEKGVAPEEHYRRMASELAIPLGRVGRAEEFADLIAFLVSERAAYLSGVAINFDGGLSNVV